MYDLFPGVFATVEMIPDSVGVWLLHCHVNDHMIGGMETLYTVYGKLPTHTINPCDRSRKRLALLTTSNCGFCTSLAISAVFIAYSVHVFQFFTDAHLKTTASTSTANSTVASDFFVGLLLAIIVILY